MTATSPAAQRALSDRERFLGFAFAAADLLAEADGAGRIGFATGAFRQHLGRGAEAFIGSQAAELIAPEDRAAFALALAALPRRGRLPPTVLRLADARATPFMVSGMHLALPGQPPRNCLCFAPLPEWVELRSTGPTEPQTLRRIVEGRMRHAPGAAGGLGLVDLPGVPEGTGPGLLEEALNAAGDGACLTAELAPGRLGLLAPAGHSLAELREILARLTARLPAGGAGVTTSALALDAPGLTPSQTIRALRHCLSVFTREGGRGLAQAGFDEGLGGFVEEMGQRSLVLARAIEEQRFGLEYQPIRALANRVTHHYEALCRPRRCVLGASEGPADFVNLAEAVGLTEALDFAVLQMASQDMKKNNPAERVAVNLSGLSVQSPAFRDRLFRHLDAAPGLAARLMVELTESAEVEQEEEAANTLAGLRERGVPVCLDDFGAGAAAFRYLRAYRVDFVKVDGAFVTAALEQERDRRFVASMVDLSHAVGAEVVAERIETPAHAQLMRELGVEYGQGWHFGRPGPLPLRGHMLAAKGKEPGKIWL
jgi:EAL domain-containing protein (putative c-di-GMP-specific phosphodiesterase class I)